MTKQQIITISLVGIIVVLCAIFVPVGIYLHDKKGSDDNSTTTTESSNTSTTSSAPTTTKSDLETVIVKDLSGLQDTFKKFQDDLDGLVQTRVKLFREEVEHFKFTSTQPAFEPIESELIDDPTTTSTVTSSTTTTESTSTTTESTSTTTTESTTTTTETTSTTTKSTTSTTTESTSTTTESTSTTPTPMSLFEQIFNEMKEDIKKVKNVTTEILADKDLTFAMDTILKDVNKDVGTLDNTLVTNVTLSDAADIALAQELLKNIASTLADLASALEFLHHGTTVTSTSTPLTTHANYETIAVESLGAINDTFNLMIVQLNEDLHPILARSKAESQLSELYDEATKIIENINKTKAELDITDGIVSADVLASIISSKNESLDVYNRLQNIKLNLTSGDQELGEMFVTNLEEAQEVIGEAIDMIHNHKPYSSTPGPTTKSSTTPQARSIFKELQEQIMYIIDQEGLQ